MNALRIARPLILVTLALLVFAVAITWYAPRAPSGFVAVSRANQPDLCGKMALFANGSLDIKPPNAPPVRLAASEVVKLTLVPACP